MVGKERTKSLLSGRKNLILHPNRDTGSELTKHEREHDIGTLLRYSKAPSSMQLLCYDYPCPSYCLGILKASQLTPDHFLSARFAISWRPVGPKRAQ